MKTCESCGKEWEPGRGSAKRKMSACNDCYKLIRRIETLFHSCQYRAKQSDLDFDLTRQWFLDRITRPCPATGLTFEINESGKSFKERHPLTPSVDKIDPEKGYTQDNCRIVVWWYNVTKQRYSDKEVLEFCRTVVNYYDTNHAKNAEAQMQKPSTQTDMLSASLVSTST